MFTRVDSELQRVFTCYYMAQMKKGIFNKHIYKLLIYITKYPPVLIRRSPRSQICYKYSCKHLQQRGYSINSDAVLPTRTGVRRCPTWLHEAAGHIADQECRERQDGINKRSKTPAITAGPREWLQFWFWWLEDVPILAYHLQLLHKMYNCILFSYFIS